MNKRITPGNAEPQLGTDIGTDIPPKLGTPNKEWYSRGYLPHRDRIDLLQSITFRLADSLPQEKLQELRKMVELEKGAELGLGVPGKSFWMREYWDRFIRNEKHLLSVIDYIHNNPVKAKLCASPEQWPWSSAHFINPKKR